MKHPFSALLIFFFEAILCCVSTFLAATPARAQSLPSSPSQDTPIPALAGTWQCSGAQHVYGFPGSKPHAKGTLSLTTDSLTFTSNSGNVSIPRISITAVSAGHQRVELWGVGGRILRMTIPDGGGIAAAAVMHHRIDMLTIEFHDHRGGMHSAVFFLAANEAERALQGFALAPIQPPPPSQAVCGNGAIDRNSVLVAAPDWDRAQVPAAYRALVYEHIVDRLRRTPQIGYVYREGETGGHNACPQYTIHIAIAAFKEGSSVKRAALGPAGFFVGTTQMAFDISITDSSSRLNVSEEIKATIRGESESTNVADHLAKTLAKHYVKVMKNAAKANAARATHLES
jgi:hypothetical protein